MFIYLRFIIQSGLPCLLFLFSFESEYRFAPTLCRSSWKHRMWTLQAFPCPLFAWKNQVHFRRIFSSFSLLFLLKEISRSLCQVSWFFIWFLRVFSYKGTHLETYHHYFMHIVSHEEVRQICGTHILKFSYPILTISILLLHPCHQVQLQEDLHLHLHSIIIKITSIYSIM